VIGSFRSLKCARFSSINVKISLAPILQNLKRNLNWNSVYSVKGSPRIIGLGGLLIGGLISSSDESDDDDDNILSKLLIQEFILFISNYFLLICYQFSKFANFLILVLKLNCHINLTGVLTDQIWSVNLIDDLLNE
jgi:hypothetical protein